MNKVLLCSLGLLALSACAPMGQKTAAFGKQPAAANLNPSGNVNSNMRFDGLTATSAMVGGLKPNTIYVAHYHVQGTASDTPCQSNGAPIMSSKIVGTSDATGNLMLSGTVATNDVKDATYFNVHTASDAMGTPADAGVACANLR